MSQLQGQNVDPKTAAKEQQSKQYEWIRYSLCSHLFDSFAMRKFNKCLSLGWTCVQIIGCTGMFSATLLGHGICSRVCQSRCVCFNYPHRVQIVQTFKKPSVSNWVWNDGNIWEHLQEPLWSVVKHGKTPWSSVDPNNTLPTISSTGELCRAAPIVAVPTDGEGHDFGLKYPLIQQFAMGNYHFLICVWNMF